jgi:phosphate starvation-inducible PhoH-like protein
MTKRRYSNLSIEPKNAKQREFLNSVSDYPVTFAIGSAGGGKTYLATFKAIEYLQYGLVDKIVVVRPAVATEDLGYLPGDLKEKIDPYLLPIWDAFEALVGVEKFEEYKENRQIEIAALAFMRGRTISNAFIILDEAHRPNEDVLNTFWRECKSSNYWRPFSE